MDGCARHGLLFLSLVVIGRYYDYCDSTGIHHRSADSMFVKLFMAPAKAVRMELAARSEERVDWP